MTDRMAVADWVARYERAWRTAATDALDELFTGTASYSPSPWAAPIEGLEAIRRFWDGAARPSRPGSRASSTPLPAAGARMSRGLRTRRLGRSE